jgi:hypothetical protein
VVLSRSLGVRVAALLVLLTGSAWADRDRTREALARFEEIADLRREGGVFDDSVVLPLVVVSASPRYETTRDWYPAEATAALLRAFGSKGVRVCEACMRTRIVNLDGRLEQTSGPASLDEVRALDDRYRGDAAPAKAGVWIDETASGVAVRIVELSTGQIIFAQNVDPELREYRGSARSFKMSAELERRITGNSLTHAFVDLTLSPGRPILPGHISLEWADQWGQTNANLSGIVLSIVDPVAGLGATYYRALEWGNILVGGKVILSLPTVIAQTQVGEDTEIIDPPVTAVAVLRVPFGGSNYGAVATFSTNGVVGIGLTLLNSSLIPVLP